MTLPNFPQTLTPNSVVGRLSANPGPTEDIPLSKLAAALSPLLTIPAGAGLVSTSTTSLTIGTGSQSLTVATGMNFTVGMFVVIAYTTAPSNYMHGSVTSYNTTTGALIVNVTDVGGSGTWTAWTVSVSGTQGSLSGGTLTGALNYAPTITLASASSVAIGAAASNNITISGTTTVTAFDTITEGAIRIVTYSGAVPITYNATSMQLIGSASRTNAVGDVSIFRSLGSGNWKELMYQRVSGAALIAEINATSDATFADSSTKTISSDWITGRGTPRLSLVVAANFSGTSVQVAIPSWASVIIINMNGMSTNGTSNVVLQLATSGPTWVTTGYAGSQTSASASVATSNFSSGFLIGSNQASYLHTGNLIMSHMGNNTWTFGGTYAAENATNTFEGAGKIALAGAAIDLRMISGNGTDTFDAGSFNIIFIG